MWQRCCIMKALNITGAFVVLICNLVVSFDHSLELFRAGGFTGRLAYLAVIGAEVTFIMGALNLVSSRMRGISPGLPATSGFILGVLLVSWANVSAGWSYGLTGVLLGLATPISLIIVEAILSRAIINRKKEDAQDDVEIVVDDPKQVIHPNTKEVQPTVKRSVQPSMHSSVEPSVQPTMHPSVQSPMESSVQPTMHPSVQSSMESSVQPTMHSSMETSVQPSNQLTQSDDAPTQKTTEVAHENSTEKISAVESPAKLALVEQKSTTVKVGEEDHPFDMAMKLYKDTGIFPTRRNLAKLANITEYRANQVIQRLKGQIS
jgi:hypothetical protein